MLAAQCFERSGDVQKVFLTLTEKPIPSPGYAVVKILAAAGNELDFKVSFLSSSLMDVFRL